jgi:hypothetical protein
MSYVIDEPLSSVNVRSHPWLDRFGIFLPPNARLWRAFGGSIVASLLNVNRILVSRFGDSCHLYLAIFEFPNRSGH